MQCNDLFSRFEQQILFLEKQAETTEPTMNRHRHDGPSWGSRSKTLRILTFGYWNRLSELRNGMAGPITGVTDRHRLFIEWRLWTLWRSRRTDRRRHDGPSQAAESQAESDFFNVLRDVFDYSCFNYKVSGLMLISLITWGLKEVTLSKLVGYYCHLYS